MNTMRKKGMYTMQSVIKSKIKSIEIERCEGKSIYCRTYNFKSIKNADRYMNYFSNTYPKQGYDKHKVKIIWEDNTQYLFRLDAMHIENEYCLGTYENNVSQAIKRSIKYYLNPENKDNIGVETIEFFNHINKSVEI